MTDPARKAENDKAKAGQSSALGLSELLRQRMRNPLVSGVMGSAALILTARVLALANSMLLARLLGVSEFGIYSAAFATVTLLGIAAGSGLPTLIVRQVAVYATRGDMDRLKGLLLRANQAVLVLSIVIAIAAATVILGTGMYASAHERAALLLALVLLPLSGLNLIRAAALRGLKRVVLGQLPQNLILSGSFTIFLVFWWFEMQHDIHLNAYVAIGLRVAATSLAFFVGAGLLLKYIPTEVRTAVPTYETRTWAAATVRFAVISGITIIGANANVLLLRILDSSASAGVYQAITRSADVVGIGVVIINFVLQPVIASLHVNDRRAQMQKVVTIGTRVAMLGAVPIAAPLILWGRPLLEWAYGQEFGRGALALAMVASGRLVAVGAGSISMVLNMTGHERIALWTTGTAILFNVALSAILIPRWGVDGAAFASAFCMIGLNIALAILVTRVLGVRTTIFG